MTPNFMVSVFGGAAVSILSGAGRRAAEGPLAGEELVDEEAGFGGGGHAALGGSGGVYRHAHQYRSGAHRAPDSHEKHERRALSPSSPISRGLSYTYCPNNSRHSPLNHASLSGLGSPICPRERPTKSLLSD